jgi:hypothetical protein
MQLVPVLIQYVRANADSNVLCSAAGVCAPDELLTTPERVSRQVQSAFVYVR